jgi:endoglucanase
MEPARRALFLALVGLQTLAVVAPSSAKTGSPTTGGTAGSADTSRPSLSISDVSVAQPVSGTRAAAFDVPLSSASPRPVTVHFATLDGSAIARTLRFAPGETSTTISVKVRNDHVASADKVFSVRLSNPSNADLANAMGQAPSGTRASPDPRPPTASTR